MCLLVSACEHECMCSGYGVVMCECMFICEHMTLGIYVCFYSTMYIFMCCQPVNICDCAFVCVNMYKRM